MKLTVVEAPATAVGAEDMRMDLLLARLSAAGIAVERIDAFSAPGRVAALGETALPAFFVDDRLMGAGRYPSNAELAEWIDYDALPRGCGGCGGCGGCAGCAAAGSGSARQG
ncbi:hypothetical protein HMP0721_1775 [Pseudoramibacter alactolyticus ATCC 23263]|uniref:Arsenical resistance operon trans-acting repressor ArsD n=1 Tax=Pseudoramibacter alactolyticus ATCC 23263 TaxID=887929 RepID=E6MIE0_9FIRM|nr:arsenic metallochaperone ArsD family protein [Pseudoramibacter alactolyticus]EFV01036.1 hypothetical protein HMP0721_1775 [Pseudoramibacter alactolyticus ATCC 23263]